MKGIKMIKGVDLTILSIKELRELKVKILDSLKGYQRYARQIDKEVKRKLKNGEVEE